MQEKDFFFISTKEMKITTNLTLQQMQLWDVYNL